MNSKKTNAKRQVVSHTVQPVVRLCVNCDEQIPRNKANRLFCSMKCQKEFNRMKEELDAKKIWWAGVWMRDNYAAQEIREFWRDGFWPGQIRTFLRGVHMRKHLHA
jgi:predicted nucleic acid-binding Zn ribbon protein